MSFAVDSLGDVFAWGFNKSNILLVNQPEKGIVKNVVEEPMNVSLPDYFIRNSRVNIVQNNNLGFDMYVSQKPVKSVSSKTQDELEKMREDNAKLRKKVRDLQEKYTRLA